MRPNDYKIVGARARLLMGIKPGARDRLSAIACIAVLLAGCSMHDMESLFMVTPNANGKPAI